MTLLSATILLFLVMDPFGNVPVFLCVLKKLPDEKQQKIILRELVIALLVLVLFLAMGPYLVEALQVSEQSIRIAGGIILFLIAIKMIFGATAELFRDIPGGDPLIVPLAIPSIAGPAAIATVMLLTAQEPDRWPEWLVAILLAWMMTSMILLLSTKLNHLLGQRGLTALEHLMGLILTVIAVEMFLQGIREIFIV